MKIRFLAGFLLILLLLTGAGCSSSSSTNEIFDEFDYGGIDDTYDDYDTTQYDSYDDSYDSYDYNSSVPQGSHSVYACNMTQDYCLYLDVDVSGETISYVYSSLMFSPNESLCDQEGCYFIDSVGSQWYFDF